MSAHCGECSYLKQVFSKVIEIEEYCCKICAFNR